MSARVTRAQLDATAQHIAALAIKLNLMREGDRLDLQIGSKTYGNAYRLMLVKAGSTGRSDLFGEQGYLGMTAAEANLTLSGIRRALDTVGYAAQGGAL